MAVLILGGTTAAGKSDLAVEIARTYGAAIVSADAMTVYRGMDIGTAKPSRETLDALPHACIDVVDPDGDFSVADFVEVFEAVQAEHEHVVVVGGTPFYLSALVRPMAEMPSADPEVRARLEALEDPHARLVEVDPASAQRLHPNDRMRVVRALEVFELTGLTMTQLHARGGRMPPVDAATVWMDAGDLDARIEARLWAMVEAGYLAEVAALLNAGWGPELRPMASFAYRHMVGCVQGHMDLDEAIRRTGRDTRRFARKQRTWARGMNWEAVEASVVLERAKVEFSRE